MNKYKLISLMSLLFISITCYCQTTLEDSEERVVVLIDDKAIVATLDSTGAVAEKILDIPAYFDLDHEDAYYVALSFKVEHTEKDVHMVKETITSVDIIKKEP